MSKALISLVKCHIPYFLIDCTIFELSILNSGYLHWSSHVKMNQKIFDVCFCPLFNLLIYCMQQNYENLVSVRHKLPDPISLLPTQQVFSEPPRHILPQITTHVSESGDQWILDNEKKNEQKIKNTQKVLQQYYGKTYKINELLRHKQRIVFMTRFASLPLQQEITDNECEMGSLTISDNINQSIKKSKYKSKKRYSFEANHLEFDDQIQSGNLFMALRHSQFSYLLANRFDYNTRSYGQWFYFKVINPRNNELRTSGYYTFYIVNMTKNGTMFGKGLKVSVCRKGLWSKQGTDIHYIPNSFIRVNHTKGLSHDTKSLKNTVSYSRSTNYYTLAFTLFIEQGQQLYISYNQPYTYSRLSNLLNNLSMEYSGYNCESHQKTMKRSIICKTPLDNRIEMVTISNKTNLNLSKKIIIIMARVHPIQTAGSHVMEGILQTLMLKNPNEKDEQKQEMSDLVNKLLDSYIFKIIPMLNPDGVIIGNSRCNLYGYDLNRQWKQNNKNSSEIKAVRRAILKYQGRIQMLIDLHGHSKKKNVFAYGCHDFRAPFASRQFPYILSKIASNDFVFKQCRFTRKTEMKNSLKQGTARISLYNKLKIPNIFTIENSYCSSQFSHFHYDTHSYQEIGKRIVQALTIYFDPIPQSQHDISTQKQQKSTRAEQVKIEKQIILRELKQNKANIQFGLQSEESSQSQEQERLQLSQNKRTSKKKSAYLFTRTKQMNEKSKTEKIMKPTNRHERKQRESPQYDYSDYQNKTEYLKSVSHFESGKKQPSKYLQPINKREAMRITKCQGITDSPDKDMGQKSESQPVIWKRDAKITNSKSKDNLNTMVSVIEIGKESFQVHQQTMYRPKIKHKNSPSYSIQGKLDEFQKIRKSEIERTNRKQISPRQRQAFNRLQPTLKPKKYNPQTKSSKFEELMRKINTLKVNSKFQRINRLH